MCISFGILAQGRSQVDATAKPKAKARVKAKAKAKNQAQKQEASSWEDTVDAACVLSSL